MITLGVDVGISTTKIVGLRDKEVFSPIRIKATDPVSSLYGALGKFLYDNKIQLNDISRIMLTGVGAAYVEGRIYDRETIKVDEYIADALGAAYKSNIKDMIVVSMGTGTTFVRKQGDEIKHLGGLGIGGGTLQGLSRVMLKTDDVREVSAMAEKGDISKMDLLIGDISPKPLPGLPMDATAALFAKAQSNSSQDDIALAIFHTVLQTIGSGAIFAALGTNVKDFVLIGNLSRAPHCNMVFPQLEKLYKVKFHIPQLSHFRTALGAALYSEKIK